MSIYKLSLSQPDTEKTASVTKSKQKTLSIVFQVSTLYMYSIYYTLFLTIKSNSITLYKLS